MKEIGLKFILKGGQYLAVTVTEDFARSVMDVWMAENYGERTLIRVGPTSYSCMVRLSEIQAMHTFDLVKSQEPSPWSNPSVSGQLFTK